MAAVPQIDSATNGDGDTGRFRMLNVWERDIVTADEITRQIASMAVTNKVTEFTLTGCLTIDDFTRECEIGDQYRVHWSERSKGGLIEIHSVEINDTVNGRDNWRLDTVGIRVRQALCDMIKLQLDEERLLGEVA